jgi:hypothetical protein
MAINTLLHEMIHIADYTLHPEHFYDDSYDSHMSDFFQGWMEKINGLGYWVTVYVGHEEINDIKAETAKKNKGKEAIAVLAKWRGESGNYDIAWTERKYMANVVEKNTATYYTALIFCYFTDTADMLTMKECKGKLMKGNIISSGKLDKYRDKVELPGFKKVNVDKLLISDNEKMMLNKTSLIITQQIISDVNKMVDELYFKHYVRGNKYLSFSSKILNINKKSYWVTLCEGITETTICKYKGTIMIDIPMSAETSKRIREEYRKRENGEAYSLARIENNISHEVEEGLREMETVEDIMRESRNRRMSLDVIVEEKIKDFVDRQTDKTDDSIVNVKELGDGSEIVTQW